MGRKKFPLNSEPTYELVSEISSVPSPVPTECVLEVTSNYARATGDRSRDQPDALATG